MLVVGDEKELLGDRIASSPSLINVQLPLLLMYASFLYLSLYSFFISLSKSLEEKSGEKVNLNG